MQANIPNGSTEVVPGCVFHVAKWLHQPDDVYVALLAELSPFMETYRGFRGFPDHTRRFARFGHPNVSYVYGGKTKPLHPFTTTLQSVCVSVSTALSAQFNCCYVNSYLSGLASIPRHSDVLLLPQLGQEPIIAAVSFGVTRTFQLWDASAPRDRSRMKQVELGHGDLCIMHGRSQLDWLHAIPKQKDVTGERLSLTFRFHNPV